MEAFAGVTVYKLRRDGFNWDAGWSNNQCGVTGTKFTTTAGAAGSTTYRDTVSTGTAITSVTLQIGAFLFCNGASVSVNFNGTVVGTLTAPASCACNGAGQATTFTITGSYGTLSSTKTLTLTSVTGGPSVMSALWTSTLAQNTADPLALVTVNYAGNSLTAPQQAAFVGTRTPAFAWTNAGGGTSFELQVATNAFFSPILVSKTALASPGYTLSGTSPELLDEGASYYVRARATNGSDTAWTPIVDFGVLSAAPAAAGLQAPGADVPNAPSAVSTTKPRFDWTRVKVD